MPHVSGPNHSLRGPLQDSQGLSDEAMSFTKKTSWKKCRIISSAHIEPGREGLFNLIKSMPPTLKYESGTIVADGDFVMVHGRFSGFGQPVSWIAADIVRIANGVLVEHWDVIEDEVSKQESKSGRPMFGAEFTK
jgi:predicted SnoaL-like aldol condensation-catalyzing enzyme